MKISDVIQLLDQWAPPIYAEDYDNVGLITGDKNQEISGILICLDSLEQIIEEAIALNANLIIAHHPIIFRGLKKINGSNYIERAIIQAIKNDIAIYAIHTNLDNIATGVNKKISDRLDLQEAKILSAKSNKNDNDQIVGSGFIGTLEKPVSALEFLQLVKSKMELPLIKHTTLCIDSISTVAVCGGSGSFLIPDAIKAGADAYITSDLKYHEFFDADSHLVLMDIGHFESEQFTIDLIYDFLKAGVRNVPMSKTKLKTNPVQYFIQDRSIEFL